MPGRYEIVDEPVEPLEVVDDDVYHPDLTVRDTPSASFRSLEPILSGPITLKTIFYDPRWSTNKRRCCVGFVAIASLICFCLMISLFVGLGQVISYINESERLRQTGLYMIPDLEQLDIPIFAYSSDKKFERAQKKYIGEIEAFLKSYKEQSPEFQNCSKPDERATDGKACRFDLNWLGTNCTKENGYGYTEGSPCVLFVVRNVKNWMPNITDGYLRGSIFQLRNKQIQQQFDQYHLPLTCSATYGTNNMKIQDEENSLSFKYYPEAGFNTTFLGAKNEQQLPPLVFVQFVRPNFKQIPSFNVKCQILAPNLDEFKGVKIMDFELDDSDNIEGTALDRP